MNDNLTSPVVVAIANLQAAISRGENPSTEINTDDFRELDELDIAAIQQFFSEPESSSTLSSEVAS